MATDIATIQANISAQLNANLNPLGVVLSASQVAEWKLWRDTAAAIDFTFETVMDIYKADVQAYIDTKQLGSLSWYALKALEFQFGDNLLIQSPGVFYYAAVDATKQVVKVAAVSESVDGDTGAVTLVIKVATIVSNVLAKLPDDQKLGFADYMRVRKIAGTKLLIVSQDPDVIKYAVDIIYNPEFAEANVQAGILAALDLFRTTYGFDPTFYKSTFEGIIKSVPGVVALAVTTLTGTPSGGMATAITLGYVLEAGYFNWDNTSSLILTPQ